VRTILNGNPVIVPGDAAAFPFFQDVVLTNSVSFCDMVGKQLLSKKFSGTSELTLGHLPAGIYFLRFPDQNQTFKLVKEK